MANQPLDPHPDTRSADHRPPDDGRAGGVDGPFWVWVTRRVDNDVVVGPFPTHHDAVVTMDTSDLVAELVEDDCVDCFTSDTAPGRGVDRIRFNPENPHHCS